MFHSTAVSKSLTPSVTRYGLLLLLTFQTTATIVCVRASMINASASNTKYVVSTLVLTMETVKIGIVLTLVVVVEAKCSFSKAITLLYDEIVCRPGDTLPSAIPSLLYVVQDNLIIHALSCVDATTYQVTYQARIVTTAVFARILLHKTLSVKRWLAIVLLMLGVILTQVNFSRDNGDFSFRSQKEGASSHFGLVSIGLATVTSGLAGVYNEKLVKNGQQPMLLIRSLQLGFFSLVFALSGVLLKDGILIKAQGYFYGYTPLLWLVAIMQATGGIVVAATMKYADSILKTFATSHSIVLSCVLSHFLLDDSNLTVTLMAGTMIILLATFLYSGATVPTQSAAPI